MSDPFLGEAVLQNERFRWPAPTIAQVHMRAVLAASRARAAGVDLSVVPTAPKAGAGRRRSRRRR